jgi:hypothetical protein
LNSAIETSICPTDMIEYRSKRANILFKMGQWRGNALSLLSFLSINIYHICLDTLIDIDFIEKYEKIDQSLSVVK